MIQDFQLVFSDAQDITGDAVSDNVVDTGVADANMGAGTPKMLDVRVDANDFDGGTSLIVNLQDSADDSSFATILSSGSHLQAALVAGFIIWQVPIPSTHRRYLLLQYDDTGAFTTGAINAHIVLQAPSPNV
jgi:hypothetical protein